MRIYSLYWKECEYSDPHILLLSVFNDTNCLFRLIVVAVFCLCIAHPGFIFNRTAKIYYSVATGAAGSDDSTYRSKLSDPVKEPMRQHDTYGA
jgi:hypothetical protein